MITKYSKFKFGLLSLLTFFLVTSMYAENGKNTKSKKSSSIKNKESFSAKSKNNTTYKKLVAAPIISLDVTNVTGAGGVNINTTACSSGWEILDNTNTGATSNFNSPDGTVMSMTITLLNSQDGLNEQLSIGGSYAGVLVAGNGSQVLTITNDGSASTNTMRNVLDDLIYKDLAANPNTVVQRQVSVQVTDAIGQISNAPIAFFNVTKAANSGNTPGPLIVFTTGFTVDLFTGLDGSQDLGGTWVDVDGTGSLAGSIVSIASLPLGGSTFRYDVNAPLPCGTASTSVLVIKMDANELPLTSSSSCGVLETNYSNPLYSANSNDPIYIFNSGGNDGNLECPAGVDIATTYDWYVFNPATNSYINYALGSTRIQNNLPDGGYLVVRNDAGTVTEGRAWIWNVASSNPNAGVDAIVCKGDTHSLNGSIGGLVQTFTHYDPVKRPFIIGPTTQISVRFNATHTYVSDLGFYFVSPSPSVTIPLAVNQANTCNSGNNISNLTFTNQGAPAYLNWCTPAVAPLTGTWNGYFTGTNPTDLPNNTNKLINWAPLYGLDANQGGWAVQIYDCIGADIGNLTGATIIFDDGFGNIVTYTSGSINVPINDNSCTPATASVYVVPSSPLVTVSQVLTINPGVGVNGSSGGWQWSYSVDGIAGPYAEFNNTTLTPNLVVNQNTWVKLTLDNSISSCNREDILFIQANPKSNAGLGTNLTASLIDPIITLANQLTGEDAGGLWTITAGSPGPGSFNAGAGTFNPALAGIGSYTFQYEVTGIAPCPNDTETFTITILADNDGDGIDDSTDLDDDNDGILDTTENPCTSAQVQWMHNASSGQSDFATFGNDTTTTSPHFTSANNISFGTGLNETTDNYPYTYLLRNATATTFAAAKTGNDYAQVSYTPSKKMYLNGINFGYFSTTGSPQFNCGNFKMAVEYSTSAAFTSPIVLLQDIQVGAMVSGGYTTVNNAISKLLLQSGTTYYFRVYFYDEQNTDPNNRVRLDDLYFPHCLFVDTDNDQTEDYLDLDSDGDGCSDANEYYNSATADGGDGGVYGTGTPSVDANGQVIGASYTGIYTNAVTATQSSIVTQPINITQEVGLNAVFTVDADAISTTTFTSGTPNFAIPPATDSSASLIYQWQESIDGGTTWTNISNGGQYSGATTNTLTVSNITLVQDQNQYQVLVSHATNPCSILSSVSTLTITISPAIVITKEGTYVDTNADGITNIGDVINYVFTVENTGNTVLTNITVTDPNAVVTGGPLASLAVGATDTTTFTATHVITQADIDAGFIYNLATATGNDPNGDPVTDTSSDPTPCATCPVDPTCPECTIVELTQSPAIVITKEGTYVDTNADGITNIGDVISYVFTVENTGNTVLTNITVTDPNAVVTGGPLASLAVGATDTTTFTATHVITQADIDAGFIYNLATATGNDPNGDPVTDTSSDPTPCATCPVDPTCPECTIVELTQSPAIVITKEGTYVDTNADGITNIGDVISYVFTVENTGNTVLTNITVTDPNAVVTGGPLASLAVGATDTTTFTATHVITQADIDAGFIYNLATATGNDPNGDPVTDTSSDPTPCATCPVDPTCPECTIVELTQSPAIVITKEGTYVDTNADGITNIGDVISYVFTVENTGNTVLTNITVTDPNAVVTGGPLASLAVGATDTTTFTATHVITQADIDAGFIYNLATATGNDPNGDPVTDTSSDPTPCATCPVDPTCPECTIVELTQSPAIVITKEGTYVDTNADGITNIGDVISYVFTVENTGNTVLTNITVTDPNAVVTGGPLASLAVGATDTTTFTATHVITQADIDAGFIYNLATATGNDPNGDPVTDTSSDPTPCATCPVDPTCPECTIVELTQSPAIVITKEGTYVDTNADGITNIGDVISYVFTVENTGNTVLTNITVTDPNAVVTGGPLASLAVGATDTTTFTATHVITQADIDAGFIYNLATATGNDPNGDPVTDTSSDPTPCATCPVDPTCPECTIVELTQSPAIVITKEGTYVDTNADGITNIGDVISYVFTVENTGNTVLTNITVTDPNAVVTGGPLASLAVGATDTTTFTATHVITQADIDAGFIYNLATATGNDPNGDPVTDTSSDPTPCATCPVDPTCPECTIVELTQSPAIVITKEGTYVDTNADGITNIGDVISYVFTVENTGNTVLTNITVTDPNAVVTGGPLASLAVGATDTTTFTATHVITQADIDAGFIYNLATATGNDPNGDPVTDTSSDPTPCATCPVDPTCPECTIVELTQSPAIVITKEGTYVDTNADGITNIGDVISYVFTVENTGNTVLTNITVTDPNAVVTGGPLASLAVGATDTTTFTATHVITQADIDAGFIYNLATATGNDPNGDPVTDTSSDPTPCATCPVDPTCPECTIVELTQSPAIVITKEGTYVDTNADGITNIGDVISYVFTVENTGNTVLTNITVTDPNAVVTGGPLASLAVGATDTTTFTATHVITQADIDAGFIYNLATATGNDPNGDPVTDTSSDPTPCATCPVDPTCPECTIVELTQSPAIVITKEGTYVDTNADGITNIGDVISYVFTVENTGNTVLTNITVTDPNAVVTGGPLASLAVGATDTTTFTATHVITQADIDAGFIYNLATATGNDPNGDPVTDTSSDPTPCATCPVDPTCPECTIVELTQSPAIVITKEGTYVDTNADGITNIGDVISYVFTVENTGNTVLTNITVTDPNAVVTGGPLASLAVGATDTTTFTATHVITQADIDAGFIYNLATATGNDPNGDPVTDTSSDPTPCATCPVDPTCPECTIVELVQSPAIVITKEGTYVDTNADGITNIGDVISYVFTVENTGNTVLTNITVTDPNAVVTGGPLASLAVGATDTTTFTATHVITQADIDAGYVYNLATATGNDPNGDPVTDESEDPTPCTTCPVDPTCPDCTIVEVEQEPAIVITKDGTYVDSNGNGVANVGDVINYVFTVQNTGNVTLTNVTVADINAVVTGGPLASLAVGATDSTTFTATHVLTQADIDAGYVYNLATATGNDPSGNPVTDESEDPTPCTTCPVDPTCPDCTIVEVEQEPAIAIVKEATFNDNNGDGFPQAGETITYTFTVTNTGNMSLFDVIVTDPLPGIVLTGGPIDLAVGQSDSTTFTATYTITQADIVFGSVVNQATASAETIDGEVVDDLSDDDSELEDDPTIVILEGCKLTIFNAVSPNGDGSNDIFYIQGIECYPNNTVEVYNRWGIKVYEVNNYDNISNVFKGYSDGRVTISRNELLPTGTYFYIIKYVDLNGNGIDKSGYLYIQSN